MLHCICCETSMCQCNKVCLKSGGWYNHICSQCIMKFCLACNQSAICSWQIWQKCNERVKTWNFDQRKVDGPIFAFQSTGSCIFSRFRFLNGKRKDIVNNFNIQSQKTQWLIIIYQQTYPNVVQSTQNSHHHEVV